MQNGDLPKEERIRREKIRLNRFYKKIDPARKGIVIGLIERAAFMRIECEDLERNLLENGWTEMFQQSEKCEPYMRYRPEGQAYQTLNANYQKIIKQLDATLPDNAMKKTPASDGFDEFVGERDDG